MGIKNSQYDQIMRAYQRTQFKHFHEQQSRIEHVFNTAPRIKDIDTQIHVLKISKTTGRILQGPAFDSSEIDAEILELTAERKALMDSNGFSPDYMELTYDCPDCHDTGLLPDGSKCSCFKQAIIDLLYDQSTLRAVTERENFDTFSLDVYPDNMIDERIGLDFRTIMKSVYGRCRNYADNFCPGDGKNLLLIGSTGVGKTFLTHAIAKELIEKCYSVVYLTSEDLRQLFEEEMRNSNSYDRNNAIDTNRQYLLESDLLIIDDLGSEMVNTFTISKLFYILNDRMLNRKSIVFSTNLMPDELSAIYTERVSSRIMSNCEILTLVGPDLRTVGLIPD